MQALMTSQARIEDLLRKAQAGDRCALGELFEAYRERLIKRIRSRSGRRVKQELDPEDVLQETFLKAFETVSLFKSKGEDSFFRWLSAIAEHLILNASRKRVPDPLEVKPEPASGNVSPSKALRRKERFDRLDQAVQGLTEDQRQVVLMARVDGLTARQIAHRMGRTEEAVRQLLARALRRLKRTIGDTESLNLPDQSLRKGGPPDA